MVTKSLGGVPRPIGGDDPVGATIGEALALPVGQQPAPRASGGHRLLAGAYGLDPTQPTFANGTSLDTQTLFVEVVNAPGGRIRNFLQDGLVGVLGPLFSELADRGNSTQGSAASVDDPSLWHSGNTLAANPTLPSVLIASAGFGHADYFSFSLTAGQTVTLDVDFAGTGFGGPAWDAAMALYGPDGSRVAISDDSGGAGDVGSAVPGQTATDPFITFTAATTGLYRVAVGTPIYQLMQDPVTHFMYRTLTGIGNPVAGDQYLLSVSMSGHAAIDVSATSITQFGDGLTNQAGATPPTYIVGSAQADLAYGNAGDDVVYMGWGDDTVYASRGSDLLDGGVGMDTLAFTPQNGGSSQVNGAVTINLSTGQASFGQGTITESGFENVIGSDLYGDTITGDAGSNLLQGYGGNDTINGGGGNDTMVGGIGNDTLDGGGGFDTLSYYTTAAAVTVSLAITGAQDTRGDGSDTATNFEELDGSRFGDRLTAAATGSTLHGLDGNDVLIGGGGDDVMDGGNGDDNLSPGAGNDLMYWSAGNDSFFGNGGTDTVDFSAAPSPAHIDLRLTGEQDTNNGNDLFSQVERVIGSALADLLIGADGGSDTLEGGGGNDVLRGFAGNDTLIGGDGGDMLDGGVGADRMTGGLGNDSYTVDNAGDIVIEAANEGADTVGTNLSTYVLPANVETLVYTGSIAAVLTGNDIGNLVSGGPQGDLFLMNQAGADTVQGMGGDDGFYFGSFLAADDRIDGGAGTDQLALQGMVNLAFAATTMTSVETVVLLPGDDTRFADFGGASSSFNLRLNDANVAAGAVLAFQANELRVGENFTLDASAETDGRILTYAGFGTETITGGQSDDGFYFGEGRVGGSDDVDGGGGIDSIGLQGDFSGANALSFGTGQLANVELIALLSGADTRFGGGGAAFSYTLTMSDGNVATGGTLAIQGNVLGAGEVLTFDGSAELDGRFMVYGGAGNDGLTGGHGADQLFGGAGADTLVGGAGADQLFGGAGDDLFKLMSLSDSTVANGDTITDFTAGDRIDLSSIGQAFHLGETAGHTGDIVVTYDPASNRTAVSLYADGDAQADAVIWLTGNHQDLGADDFVL